MDSQHKNNNNHNSEITSKSSLVAGYEAVTMSPVIMADKVWVLRSTWLFVPTQYSDENNKNTWNCILKRNPTFRGTCLTSLSIVQEDLMVNAELRKHSI